MIRLRGPNRQAMAVALVGLLLAAGDLRKTAADAPPPPIALISLGDSLTHGTMDAANNFINTGNAYMQRVADALGQRVPLAFNQPFFAIDGHRIDPSHVPTNLGVDGADSFTLEGLAYYKRNGVDVSFLSAGLLADKLLPSQLDDKYDRVLYPLNVLAQHPVSQMGGALWLLQHGMPAAGASRAITIYWVGNNDSSTAALGFGGSNPTFAPLPAEQLQPVLPGLSALLQLGQASGAISTEPYTAASIERNMTVLQDFGDQQQHLLDRLITAGQDAGVDNQIFILTLPYYSVIGYLFDSDDIEFYLRKVNPAYTVPPSFARVAPPGQPITEPLRGDRVSLLTFGIMYGLLNSGLPVSFVNQVLEVNGQQRDGLVLSEAEVRQIITRINGFNRELRQRASADPAHLHLVDTAVLLNSVLSGAVPLTINGHKISRKWSRGSSFTLDGVHPGYTGQALVANFVLSRINADLGLDAPMASLPAVMATDPYVDRDGDGWVSGPNYDGNGITQLLFLFRDPDDTDPNVQVTLPDNFWPLIRDALLGQILKAAPALREDAQRLGLVATPE